MKRKELEFAKNLAQEAGKEILTLVNRGIKVTRKFDGSPVTNADMLANELIVNAIRKNYPNDGIISEELEDVSGERTWYIDPIDGTRGFKDGRPDYAVHIGMCAENQPTLGVVYQPKTQKLYSSINGDGAWLQIGKKIQRLDITSLLERKPIGIIGYDHDPDVWEEPIFSKLGIEDIIRSGSEGLRVMKIAQGLADFRVSGPNCGPWDVCAPHAILLEAGGSALYLDGTEISYDTNRQMKMNVAYARNQELLEKGLWRFTL